MAATYKTIVIRVNNNLVGDLLQTVLYDGGMPKTDTEKAVEFTRSNMERLNWSQGEVAQQARAYAASKGITINLSQQSVGNFLVGNTKRMPAWYQFVVGAVAAHDAGENVSPTPKVRAPSPSYHPEPDMPPVKIASRDDGAIDIRQVDLSYAMGDGTELTDYPEETAVKFDPNFLRSITKASPGRLFVARGDGDSMMPTLINNDMVLIDTTQRTLNMQDRIWACALHGAGMIKRLRVVGEGRVEVRSDNKTVGDREVNADELHIVGRVIWIGRQV